MSLITSHFVGSFNYSLFRLSYLIELFSKIFFFLFYNGQTFAKTFTLKKKMYNKLMHDTLERWLCGGGGGSGVGVTLL